MPVRLSAPHVRPVQAALALALSMMLGGCASLRPTQMAQEPDDYRERHPIVLVDTVRALDIFPSGGSDGLGPRQVEDVRAFADEYRVHGKSGLTAAVPDGPGAQRALATVRSHLGARGAGHALRIVPFRSDGARGAAPIRLSFTKLQAKVATECGLWPKDLAGSIDKQLIPDTWRNRPYHNLGCSYQSHIAAQVANPLDLVRPRPEGPIDVAKRTKDIEDLRDGTDPSTEWRKQATTINQAVQ